MIKTLLDYSPIGILKRHPEKDLHLLLAKQWAKTSFFSGKFLPDVSYSLSIVPWQPNHGTEKNTRYVGMVRCSYSGRFKRSIVFAKVRTLCQMQFA